MKKGELTTAEKFQECSECGSTHLMRHENRRTTCLECGFVLTSNASKRDKVKGLQVMPKTRNDRSSNGGIQSEIRESVFEKSSLNRDDLIERWRRSACVSDQTEKNLVIACSEIIQIGFALSLPKEVLEKASKIYRTIVENRFVKGRDIRYLVASAVYIACRQSKLAHTLEEIATAKKIDKLKVSRCYRSIVKELKYPIPRLQANIYLYKISKKLAIDSDVEEIADKILTTATNRRLTLGKNPVGAVAAAIYIASLLTGKNKTQREIAETCRVTEATIRNRCREFMMTLLFIVDL